MPSYPIARSILSALRSSVPKKVENFVVTHSGLEQYMGGSPMKQDGPEKRYAASFDNYVNWGHRSGNGYMPSDRASVYASSTATEDPRYVEYGVSFSRLMARMTVEKDVLLLRKVTKDAAIDILTDRTQRMMNSMKRMYNAGWWTGQSGVLAEVAANVDAGASVITLKRNDPTGNRFPGKPGARHCWKDMKLRAIRGGVALAGGFKVARAKARTAAGIDTIYTTQGIQTALQAGDVLVEGDSNDHSYNECPNGILDLCDDGSNSVFFNGKSRVSYPRLGRLRENTLRPAIAEGNAGFFQPFEHALLDLALESFAESTGRDRVLLLGRPEVFSSLVRERELITQEQKLSDNGVQVARSTLMAQSNQGGGKGPASFYGGYAVFKYFHPAFPGGVDIMRDYSAPYGQCWGVVPENFESLSWQEFEMETGFGAGGWRDAIVADANRPIYEIRWTKYYNRNYVRPDESFLIDQIQTTDRPTTID